MTCQTHESFKIMEFTAADKIPGLSFVARSLNLTLIITTHPLPHPPPHIIIMLQVY